MSRPIRAGIDLSALAHNLERARALAGAARVCAVIKAHAYGHGLLRAARAFAAADAFGLLEVDNAVRLREAGFAQPIVLLEGFFEPAEFEAIERCRLASVIHSREQIDMLDAAPATLRLDVFLKLTTGMNRLGFGPAQFAGALAALRAQPRVASITLMTHFADADGAGGVAAQLGEFESTTHGLALPRSLANSAALMRFPATRADWVRPGIMLYGVSPFAGRVGADEGLRPAMTLTSRIIAVQSLAPGQSVGYGSTFTADRAMRIGVVACGYADGYPRHAPSGAPVQVEGVATRTVGRVSMDMLCVDLAPVPAAGVGSAVTLWGDGLPVERVAETAGTIGYELLCALAARVAVDEIGGA
ncbi:MAG TPA: alanine racemase [Burkholderiales bacterium]|nr:alanine racemase [Burkholderiales bacterium]